MSSTLKFWAVGKDGRGKWFVRYDPRHEIKDEGIQRFAFETLAHEYVAKKKLAEKAAAADAKAHQEELL